EPRRLRKNLQARGGKLCLVLFGEHGAHLFQNGLALVVYRGLKLGIIGVGKPAVAELDELRRVFHENIAQVGSLFRSQVERRTDPTDMGLDEVGLTSRALGPLLGGSERGRYYWNCDKKKGCECQNTASKHSVPSRTGFTRYYPMTCYRLNGENV